MKRIKENRTRIGATVGILLAAAFLAMPHFAHAVSVWDLFSTPSDIITKLMSLTMEIVILPLASFVLYITGVLLDYAVQFSLHTAYIFSMSPAINLGWVIIRDIANIFFIFILIWISLGTIVNGLRFKTADKLKSVIIAAILINFSLFFTKAIIDVSNVFGLWLYGGVENTLIQNSTDRNNPTSISGLLATRLDIIQFWASNAKANQDGSSGVKTLIDPSKGITYSIIRLIIVLIATYIFAYAAILFIARAVELLFLLVFSPIAFMGGVLPPLKTYSKEWWSELTNAAIFPIAFLLLLYISLQFIDSLDKIAPALNSLSTVNAGGVLGFGDFNMSDLFRYFLIIFLLHTTLSISKKYSGEMGKKFEGFAKGLAEAAVGVAGGTAAFAGKLVIGGAASRVANNAHLNQLVANGGVIGSVAGSAQNRLNKVADYHFDPRAGAGLGIKPGKGYKAMMEDRAKQQEKAQKALAPSQGEIATAKGFNAQIEKDVYSEHGKYGSLYRRASENIEAQNRIIDDTTSTTDDRERAIKEKNKAQKNLDTFKRAIDDDVPFDAAGRVLEGQQKKLEDLKKALEADIGLSGANRDKYENQIDALQSTMRQQKAIKKTEGGVPTEIAKSLSKSWRKQSNMERLGTVVAMGLTGGLAKMSSGQFVSESKKSAKKLRDVKGEGAKKKQANDLAKTIASMAAGEEEAPPAPPAAGGAGGGAPAA